LYVVTALLFLAAFVGGSLNAVAGGGSFITLPALMYSGVAPVAANATSAFAMWPASLSSVIAYRRELVIRGRWVALLAAASVIGGLLGGFLLISNSDSSFLRVLPWVMLVTAVTFTFSEVIARRVGQPSSEPPASSSDLSAHRVAAVLLQLAIAGYGGYFGGGMGIMMLATFAIAGMKDIHEMNGLKLVLSVAINGVALAEFIATGAVAWMPGLVMVAGGIAGGYVSAATARRIDQRYVRLFIVVIAWILTVYFFIR
jgi:uncharacterized protein